MTTSGQRQGRGGIERCVGEDAGVEAREGGSGDHGGVVGREGATGEKSLNANGFAAIFEGRAQLSVSGDATGNEDRGCASLFRGGKGAIAQVADDGVLKFANQSKSLCRTKREQLLEFALPMFESGSAGGYFRRIFGVFTNVVENGSL